MRVKSSKVKSFTLEAIVTSARSKLVPVCDVRSGGPVSFCGEVDSSGTQSYIIVGQRKPLVLPQFTWVNIILGKRKSKTMIGCGYKSFKCHRYACDHLPALAYACPFSHRPGRLAKSRILITHAATHPPACVRLIWQQTAVHC